MDDFDIEKQTEPPSDYVSWSLNNFKVEDVADHSALCNFDPWDTDSCGAVGDLHVDTKPDFDDGANDKSDFTNLAYDRMDLKDVKVEVSRPRFTVPERIDTETLVTENKLSTVDLGHICEIVGNKEDAGQSKQFICLYCGLQLSWTQLCFHMKFGHNSHDKVKLCKRFDCEYHSKVKMGTEADMSLSSSSISIAVNNNNTSSTSTSSNSNKHPSSDMKEACTNGTTVEQTAAASSAEIRKCPDCAFVTSKKASLREHIKYNHPKEDDPELHRCLICGFQTKYKYGLKKHAKKHSKLTLHKCPCCDYSTILPLLLEHIKFKHTDEQLEWSGVASGSLPLPLQSVDGREQAPGEGAQLEIRPLASTGGGPAAAFEIMPSLQLPQ